MRKIAAVLLVAALAMPAAFAQEMQSVQNITLMLDYDLDSTSYTACVTTGQGDRVWSPDRPGSNRITTATNGSTTTTAVSGEPFTPIAAGDILKVAYSGATPGGTDAPSGLATARYIVTRSSTTSVVVNSSWDLSIPATGYGFVWRKRTCGTTSTSGVVPMKGATKSTWQIQFDQMDVTGGIDYRIECMVDSATSSWVQVIPTSGSAYNITATGTYQHAIDVPEDYCRLVVKIGSADDGADTTTHAEKISAQVTVWR